MNSIIERTSTRLLSISLLFMPLAACDVEGDAACDFAEAPEDIIEEMPTEVQLADLPLAAPPESSMYSVDLDVYNELFHYYYLHLDYYNFQQNIITPYGCSETGVVFWWNGANQGHTGEANIDRFIDRLDTIEGAADVPLSYRNYAGSLSGFFTSVKNALNSCTGA